MGSKIVRQDTWTIRLFIVVTGCLLTASSVWAQTAKAQPNEEAKKRARTAYGRGQELYKAEKYQEAEASFLEAFESVPNPVVLLSIGETQKKLGRPADAVATFERYLEMRPEAVDRPEIEKKISELRATPATLVVTSDPSGAAIRVDGTETGKVTPAEIELAPGQHKIGLSLGGQPEVTQDLDAQFGVRHEMQVALGGEAILNPFEAGAAGTSEEQKTEPEQEPGKGANVLPWIVIGTGGAVLVVGTVLGAMALGAKSDFNKDPTKKKADKTESLALFSDVTLCVGAAAIITGVVLLVTQGSEDSEEETAAASASSRTEARLRLVPAISPGYSGISTQLKF